MRFNLATVCAEILNERGTWNQFLPLSPSHLSPPHAPHPSPHMIKPMWLLCSWAESCLLIGFILTRFPHWPLYSKAEYEADRARIGQVLSALRSDSDRDVVSRSFFPPADPPHLCNDGYDATQDQEKEEMEEGQEWYSIKNKKGKRVFLLKVNLTNWAMCKELFYTNLLLLLLLSNCGGDPTRESLQDGSIKKSSLVETNRDTHNDVSF